MARLTLTDFYEVPGESGLWIKADLGGSSWRVSNGPYLVTITFPAWHGDRWPEIAPERPTSGGANFRSGTEELISFAVTIVRVDIDFQADLEAADFEANVPRDRFEEISQTLDAAQKAAHAVVAGVVRTARVGQPWLGLADQSPRRTGPAITRDESGRPLRIGPPVTLRRVVIEMESSQALSEDDLADFSTRWSMTPPTPESLLADARYLITYSEPPDASRAVLIAAIACEVKAKEVLAAKAVGAAAELLSVVLKEHRSFPLALLALLDGISKAVNGHSLREEDGDTFAAIRGLVNLRNDIAHRALAPEMGPAQRSVHGAQKLFSWLDDLPSPGVGQAIATDEA